RADCEHMRATIEMFAGDVLDAHRLLRREAERIAALDPVRAAQMLTDASIPCVIAGDLGLALETAQRACELAAGCGGETEMLARARLGYVLVARGEAGRGYPMVIDALARVSELPPSVHTEPLRQMVAETELWVEDYERARDVSVQRIAGMRAATALT